MSRQLGSKALVATACAWLALTCPNARSSEATLMPQSSTAIQSLDDLVSLSAPQLEQLFRQSQPGPVPDGRVKGRLLYPDSRFPRARSNSARLVWQGKVFRPEQGTATNKFFGINVVKGNVYSAPSWLDGSPSMILDYQGTSRILGNYRDEIRQVAPGLYLGLMYARTEPTPTFRMYFAFSTVE